MKKEKWVYETKCLRCGFLNGWIFNPNGNKPEEKEISYHKMIEMENPFKTEWCEKCKIETRQEWVCIYKK